MYNKLFTKILDSSIWLESMPTRIVWLTMLAAMDEDGFCQFASIPNVAHRARVSLEEAEHAIACLESPDPNSSNPDHHGRRLERVPGGWIVINAKVHREMVTRLVQRENTRLRVRRHREKNKDVTNGQLHVTKSNASEAYADAETEADPKKDQDQRVDAQFAQNDEPIQERSKPSINGKALTKLAFTVIDQPDAITLPLSELSERLKIVAAGAQLPYDSNAVNLALVAALAQRKQSA